MYVLSECMQAQFSSFRTQSAATYPVKLPKKFEVVINLKRRTSRGEASIGASAKAWQTLSYNLELVRPTVLLRQRPELWAAADACLISLWLGDVHTTR